MKNGTSCDPQPKVCTIRLVKIKKAKARDKKATGTPLDEKDLLCNERLDASSPELWPEQVNGISRFMSSVVPIGCDPEVDTSPCEWTGELGLQEMNQLSALARLSESAIVEKVKEYHNLSYELGLEEAHEMMRGNLLHVFSR